MRKKVLHAMISDRMDFFFLNTLSFSLDVRINCVRRELFLRVDRDGSTIEVIHRQCRIGRQTFHVRCKTYRTHNTPELGEIISFTESTSEKDQPHFLSAEGVSKEIKQNANTAMPWFLSEVAISMVDEC